MRSRAQRAVQSDTAEAGRGQDVATGCSRSCHRHRGRRRLHDAPTTSALGRGGGARRSAGRLRRGDLRGRRLTRRDQPAGHRSGEHGTGARCEPSRDRRGRHRSRGSTGPLLRHSGRARRRGSGTDRGVRREQVPRRSRAAATGTRHPRDSHGPTDVGHRSVQRRVVARRRGLPRDRGRRTAWPARSSDRIAVAPRRRRAVTAHLEFHGRRGPGVRTGGDGALGDRGLPTGRCRSGGAPRLQGHGPGPGLASSHRYRGRAGTAGGSRCSGPRDLRRLPDAGENDHRRRRVECRAGAGARPPGPRDRIRGGQGALRSPGMPARSP